MAFEERDQDGTTIPSPSMEPDTEPMDPPTPVPSTESIDVAVSLESSVQPLADHRITEPSNLAATARSREQSGRPTPIVTGGDSNTTLQSMMKPDAAQMGEPHSRRFLRLENDLDQASATIKLLEKGLISAQKEARIAWILGTCALVAAALAIAL